MFIVIYCIYGMYYHYLLCFIIECIMYNSLLCPLSRVCIVYVLYIYVGVRLFEYVYICMNLLSCIVYYTFVCSIYLYLLYHKIECIIQKQIPFV